MSEEHWLNNLELQNEDLKVNPVLTRFPSLEEALKSIPEAKAYQGRSIALPPEDATPDMWKEFDGKLIGKVPGLIRKPSADDPDDRLRFLRDLGLPESEAGYKPPEGIDLPDNMVKDLTSMAFASNLTQEQYEALLKTYSTAHAERTTEAETAKQEADELLTKKFGRAKDDNLAINQTLFQKFADKDHPVDIESVSVPVQLMMANMAKALTSDPQIFNQIQTVTSKKTPAEMKSRLEEIRTMLLDGSVRGDKRKTLLREQGNLYEELDRY